MNTQRYYRKIIPANKETKYEHSTNHFTGINNVNPSTDEEVWNELFDGYDAEKYDKERYEALNNDLTDSEYIETVSGDKDNAARHNKAHSSI